MTTDQASATPFASPLTSGEAVNVSLGAYEIQGGGIVGSGKIVLPHACVKCGKVLPEFDGSTRRKEDLYWVHPAIFVLVVKVLIFLIVYLATRKKCHVEFSICRQCHGKQRMNHVYAWISMAVFLGMIALVITFEYAWLSLGVIFSFLMVLAFAIRTNGPLKVKAYKMGVFQLRGASPVFLQFAQG
ncbi:hypothetical protein [Bremerella sp.]|uniref:hypothetical protein n=1 Tax=Bremerella sp. TaxID=2795602 RepID=UPI00391A8F0D